MKLSDVGVDFVDGEAPEVSIVGPEERLAKTPTLMSSDEPSVDDGGAETVV